jgi:anti-sigma factor RsiW
MDMRQLVLRRPGRALVMPVQHLSATEIAAFIDSTLSPEARAAAEFHLSDCPRCREELASCLRLARTAPSRSRPRVSWPLVGSIAAAILIVAVLRPITRNGVPSPARERATTLTPSGALSLSPAGDATIARRDLQLVWRRDLEAVGYRIVITDSAGAPAWNSADVTDTSVVPPTTAPLNPGARYFWRVDVLHADGSTAQSATRGFRIAP